MTSESILILQEIATELKDDFETLKSLSKILAYTGSYHQMSPEFIVPTENTGIAELLSAAVGENRPFRDLRLRRLVFRNFRTFPDAGYKPYAINLENGKGPCSIFLVGSNGTGKSTIFDAIEYYYAHKVSNAEQKAVDIDGMQSYLTFGFGQISEISTDKVSIEVTTQEGRKDVGLTGHHPVCQSAPFCSDYDIAKIAAREDGNLYNYIFSQLGYSELLDLQKRIREIIQLTEKNDDDNDLNTGQVFLDTNEVETVIRLYMENYHSIEIDKYTKAPLDGILEEVLSPEFLQEDLSTSGRLFPEQWKQLQNNAENFVKQYSITDTNKFKKTWIVKNNANKLKRMYQLRDILDKKSTTAANLFNICKKYAKASLDEILEEVISSKFLQEDLNSSGRLFPEQWKQLQDNAKNFKNESITFKETKNAKSNASKLMMMYGLLYDTLDKNDFVAAFNLFTNKKKEAEQYQTAQVGTKESREEMLSINRKAFAIAVKIQRLLDSAISKIVKDFIDNYHTFIETSLAYFSKSSETFRLQFENKDEKPKLFIAITVGKEEGNFTGTPNNYLNSFRFKLYAIALKLSLAFQYMQKNRCILPIAIDDVFNANDFENSGLLQQFVRKIYQVYQDKVSAHIPLQVIVLTHDELILNAFRKGFNVSEISRWGESGEEREKAKQAYSLYSGNCIVGRLFTYGKALKMYNKIHKSYLYSDILNLYIPLN